MTEGSFFEENHPHIGMTPIRGTKQKCPTRFNFCKHGGIIYNSGGFFAWLVAGAAPPEGRALGTGTGDGHRGRAQGAARCGRRDARAAAFASSGWIKFGRKGRLLR